MGNLIIKVIDNKGNPIPTAQFNGKSACGYCVVNCEHNLNGSSDEHGIIAINTGCGFGGGHAWGYVEAVGFDKKKVDTDLDYWGGDTHITIGLNPVSGGCHNDDDCPEGWRCVNGVCKEASNPKPWEWLKDWIMENWIILLGIAIIFIALIGYLYLKKQNKVSGYSIAKAMEKVAPEVAKGTGKATGIIKDLAILGA